MRRIHQRIAGVNPAINAVVASRPRAARAEADAADARLRAERPSRLPPLHGVPCTIKEAFALTGMAHTSGLVARRAEDLPLVLSALSEQPEVDTSIDAQAHAAEVLARRGARVKLVRLESLGGVFDMWAAAMQEASESTFNELLGQGTPFNPVVELARFLVGQSPYTFPAVGLLAVEGLLGTLEARATRAVAAPTFSDACSWVGGARVGEVPAQRERSGSLGDGPVTSMTESVSELAQPETCLCTPLPSAMGVAPSKSPSRREGKARPMGRRPQPPTP